MDRTSALSCYKKRATLGPNHKNIRTITIFSSQWLEYAYIVGVEWAALIVNDTARVSEGYLPYCTSVSHHGVSVVSILPIEKAFSLKIQCFGHESAQQFQARLFMGIL